MSDSWICNGWTFKLIYIERLILINTEQSTKIVKTSTDGGGYNKTGKRYSRIISLDTWSIILGDGVRL